MYIFYKSSKKKNVDKDITIIFLYLHLFKRKIINAMRQAHLIWIADHRLDIKQQDEILSLCRIYSTLYHRICQKRTSRFRNRNDTQYGTMA
jgi:hypothetical protein